MSRSLSLTACSRSLASFQALRADAWPVPASDGDGLLAGVVGCARGALGWMRGVARRADAPVPFGHVEGEVHDGRGAREIEVLIARARVVADGRAALVAPGIGAACDCPDCGASIGRAKFCPECGRGVALVRSCRMCEAELPGASRFCVECGAQD